MLEELLPAGIAIAERFGDGDPSGLVAGERPRIVRAALIRAREFAAGRNCAQQAAAHFGIEDGTIGVRADHRPQWPPALTGSLTHTEGYTAAALGPQRRYRAIGIDAERIGGVSRDLWSYLLLPTETDWLERQLVLEQAAMATLIFSAKEAFYKCQYEVTQQWLEFKDVRMQFLQGTPVRGCVAIYPAGSVRLFERDADPVTIQFASVKDLMLTAMVLTN